MGLNNEHAGRVVFDIETAPLEDAAEYLVEPIEAPANYKDPEKIAAYIAAKQAEQLAKCALDVDLCRVVAIGWWAEGEPALDLDAVDVNDENGMIADFWDTVRGRQLVGFNSLDFDLPVLLRRSLYLKVPAPKINLDRYRTDHVDLMQILSFNGKLRARGLAFYTKRFGFAVPDVIESSEVGQAVAEGRWDDVRAHVTADVTKTALLAAQLGYFSKLSVSLSPEEQIA